MTARPLERKPSERKRIFAQIRDRAAAHKALSGFEGWFVPTRVMLPMGEIFDLCLRLTGEGLSCVMPAMVVGRRPGEGMWVRSAAAALEFVEHEKTLRAVTASWLQTQGLLLQPS